MSDSLNSLLTTSQAAFALGVSPSTLWRRIQRLKTSQRWSPVPVKLGTSFLYKKTDIELLRAAFRR